MSRRVLGVHSDFTTGGGTANLIPKGDGAGSLIDSSITDNGTIVSTTEAIQLTKTALAATTADALVVQNTTLSTAIATQQVTPGIHLLGHVWNTTAVAADNFADWRIWATVASGTTPNTTLNFDGSISATSTPSYATRLSLRNDGAVTVAGNFIAGGAKFTVGPSGNITLHNNLTTAGQSFSTILGVTSAKSETTTPDANVLTVAGVAGGTYRVGFICDVSAATSGVIGWTITYTDSNSSARTPTNLALFQTGAAAPALTFTTSAASNYYGETYINSGTTANIVVKWTGGGTTTAKVTAYIERII